MVLDDYSQRLNKRKERNKKIINFVEEGFTFSAIGRKFGLTRERIRQIFLEKSGKTGKDMSLKREEVYQIRYRKNTLAEKYFGKRCKDLDDEEVRQYNNLRQRLFNVRERKKKAFIKKRCIACGKEFETKSKCIKLCSKDCKNEWQKKKSRESARSYRENVKKDRKKYNIILKNAREYKRLNKDKLRPDAGKRHKKWLKNPRNKLSQGISTSITRGLKNGKEGKNWREFVDFTIDELKKHLEKQFKSGMSWENYGEWHIDHKKPVSMFNFNSPEDPEFKLCWCLANLQPLWAKDNIIKGNKF